MPHINDALGALDIMERHGVSNMAGAFVDVRDEGCKVRVVVSEGTTAPRSALVTPEQARYLARKLYRLSKRAEARIKANEHRG